MTKRIKFHTAPTYTPMNMREVNGVKFWQSPNDPNHTNEHAEIYGVEFFAFPYQSLYARVGNKSAKVARSLGYVQDGKHIGPHWTANTSLSLPNGKTEWVEYKSFLDGEEDKAVEWAAVFVSGLNMEGMKKHPDNQRFFSDEATKYFGTITMFIYKGYIVRVNWPPMSNDGHLLAYKLNGLVIDEGAASYWAHSVTQLKLLIDGMLVKEN